jgi:hypothetical protein
MRGGGYRINFFLECVSQLFPNHVVSHKLHTATHYVRRGAWEKEKGKLKNRFIWWRPLFFREPERIRNKKTGNEIIEMKSFPVSLSSIAWQLLLPDRHLPLSRLFGSVHHGIGLTDGSVELC